MQTRQTSHRGDEIICFASMLGMDPSHILTTKDVETRLKILFDKIPTVPVSILWSTGPKLKEHGYRWAPSSLFAGVVNDGDITPVETDENGMMLCSQGLLLTGSFYDPENSLCVYQDEEEEGIWYKLYHDSSWHKKPGKPEDPNILEHSVDEHIGSSLALIYNGDIERLASAALVSDCDDTGHTIRCRYERHVRLLYATSDDIKHVSVSGEVESAAKRFGSARRKSSSQRWHVA